MSNKYEAEYRRARAQFKQNLSRMEKKGYDISAIEVPDIPKRITKASVSRIRKLNEQRYEKATKDIIVADPTTGDITTRTVTGTEGLHRTRSEASATVYQRRLKEVTAEANATNELAGIDTTIIAINPISGRIIKNLGDVEKGKIRSLNDVIDYRDEGIDTPLPPFEADRLIYENALNDLIETSKWRGGGPGRSQITGNAFNIASQLQKDYADDPEGTVAVLKTMLGNDQYVPMEYLYDEVLGDNTVVKGSSKFEDRFRDLYEEYQAKLEEEAQAELEEE